MKPKILIVSDFFYPHWTGISKSMDYVTQFLKQDIDFRVLTVNIKNRLGDTTNRSGVQIIRKPDSFGLSRARFSMDLIKDSWELIKKSDAVLINSPSAHILPIALITKLAGKRLVIFHQGDLILPGGLINWMVERVFDFSTLFSMAVADRIGCYTKDYAESSRVLKYFLGKFSAVIPPVPRIGASGTNSVSAKLNKLRQEGKILFGFAGRFVEEKGFDVLFSSIPRVIEQMPNAYFVFAGETNVGYENFFAKTQPILSAVKNRVIFLGLLKDQGMASFYRGIDFIIIPSRSDCFNLVQAEAALAGKPVIVSDIPGARYLVTATGFGLKFEKESLEDLAEKIVRAQKIRGELQVKHRTLLDLLDNDRLSTAFREFLLR